MADNILLEGTGRFYEEPKFTFITNRQIGSPSIYIAFLVGTCN